MEERCVWKFGAKVQVDSKWVECYWSKKGKCYVEWWGHKKEHGVARTILESKEL